MDKKDLRIVFMGTPDFAVPVLKSLISESFNVVAVITSPDRQSGRGRKLNQSAVKKAAESFGIPVLQPLNLKSPEFLSELQSYNPNLQIVVAFRMLPQIVWGLPSLGTFNLHASLLPHYRGAAPINYAIINGETKTGISTFFLDKEIDTGKIIKQQEVSISPTETAGSLHDKLMLKGAKLVIDTTYDILKGNVKVIKQSSLSNESELKTAPKLLKTDCLINWNNSAVNIHNLVRGLSPYPAAFGNLATTDNNIIAVKIFETVIISKESDNEPGFIDSDNKTYIHVNTQTNKIAINEIQFPGKKRMNIKDALMGIRDISKNKFQ